MDEDAEYGQAQEVAGAEVSNSSGNRLPITLPWHPRQTVTLGTMFRPQEADNPWGEASPFKKHSTSSSAYNCDHMSLGLGVGVRLPFLSSIASVSVQGSYDRDVEENIDSNKTSIRSSIRAGYVSFERPPQLTTDAIITIKYNGGLPAFHEKHGDYYVAGYRIGGDTGLMVSGASYAKSELEKLSVTVAVKVLFIHESVTHTKEFAHAEKRSSVKLCGYDTLGSKTWKSAPESTSLQVQEQAREVVSRSQDLGERIEELLDELDIRDGDELGFEDCKRLTESGLVVELVLLPVSNLREVAEWLLNDDVI